MIASSLGSVHRVPAIGIEVGSIACVAVVLDGDADRACRQARDSVTDAEWARAQRYVHSIDAARHLVGRALVRAALARALGIQRYDEQFLLDDYGKPRLAGQNIEFNISHSGQFVCAAFSCSSPIGIDVELIDASLDPLELAGALHPAEAAEIARMPPGDAREAFYRCWVRKESVLKATGDGLSLPLSSFRVATGAVAGAWLESPPAGVAGEWTTADLAVATGYYCSVAAPVPAQEVRCQVIEW